jgi:hypothetical protein
VIATTASGSDPIVFATKPIKNTCSGRAKPAGSSSFAAN